VKAEMKPKKNEKSTNVFIKQRVQQKKKGG
jgi:hypothetical protein